MQAAYRLQTHKAPKGFPSSLRVPNNYADDILRKFRKALKSLSVLRFHHAEQRLKRSSVSRKSFS